MSYVQDMRAFIGHQPLLLVGAGALLLTPDGRFLLQQRSDNGLWGISGGAIELNETVEDGARREVWEETSLHLGEMTLFGVFSGPEQWHEYPNGDLASIVSVVFLCRDWTGDMEARDGESLDLRFFAPSDVPPENELSPPSRPIVRAFLNHLQAGKETK